MVGTLIHGQEVEKWIPPTSDHIPLKEFALEQIDLCLPDYNSGYYQKSSVLIIEICG